ncbi:AMP-binding protein [Luedemannella helvata]|uniref:Long-chain fatty acid--CoA ligase n=1 Tax=Luedemannella helvata TaxID=349315 RepID=A0ABP4WW89_9ACTN
MGVTVPDSAPVPDDIRNLADTVRRAAAADPTARALIAGTRVLTWGELDARVDAVAAGLAALGLPGSDGAPARVAIVSPNVPEFAVAYFGALRAGLVAVPVNPGYTPRELAHVLGDSGASVVIGTGAALSATATVRAQLPALRHAYALESGADAAPLADLAAPRTGDLPGRGGEDLAVLLYTSGTAGAPKGAMLSHRALIANHRQLGQVTPTIVGGGDVVLLALPLFHAYGLNAGLGAVAWHGATGVLAEGLGPAEVLALLARHQVTVVAAVPQTYHAWSMRPELAEATASVRVMVSGAAPLDPITQERIATRTGRQVRQGYGLTETAPVVTTDLTSPVAKAGSIGRPIPGVRVRLVGGDGMEIVRLASDGIVGPAPFAEDGDDAFPGTAGSDPGEVVVAGDNLFSGYWPDAHGGPDEQGWWRTGDIAYADGDGDLFLVDRLGEMIIVNGFNVYPHEVENVIVGCPGVTEAAVVGAPDPETGEAVRAYVVLAPGSRASVADIVAHCELNLARYKRPRAIEIVGELPHSATGKVRKSMLRSAS